MGTFIQILLLLHWVFISTVHHRVMRCDLHVHSLASGMFTAPVLNRFCRESYNQPLEVYNRLKQLGMSVVTLTDHDSIEGAEELRRFPDFFLSEEVTVRMPSGTEMHLGVYGITERDHLEIGRRRTDLLSLLIYLTERKLFFSVNHIYSGLTGRRDPEDYRWFESYAPAFETRNGQMWQKANASASRLAARLGKVGIGGSDSHTIAGVGKTYTEVPGACSIEEFFSALRAGQGQVEGAHGGYGKLTLDVFSIVGELFSEKWWTRFLAPAAVLVPLFTAHHWLGEIRFCKRWSRIIETAPPRREKLWELDSPLEANWAR